MRYGIAVGEKHIETCKNLGLDYMEYSLCYADTLSDEQVREIVAQMNHFDFYAECINGAFPGDFPLIGERYSEDKLREYLKKNCTRAASFRCKKLVFGSGAARTIPADMDMEEGILHMQNVFRIASDITQEYGIKLIIEPLNSKECNILTSVAKACDFIRQVGHKNLYCLCDGFHQSAENCSYHEIVENKDLMAHFHFARYPDRAIPSNDDGFDYSPYINAIKEIGYDETLTVEAGSEEVDEKVRRTLAFFNSHFTHTDK